MQTYAASSVSGSAPPSPAPWQPGAPYPPPPGGYAPPVPAAGYNGGAPYVMPPPPGMNAAAAKGAPPVGWESVMGSGSLGAATGPPMTRCEFTTDSGGRTGAGAGAGGGVGAKEALESALDSLYQHQARCCHMRPSGQRQATRLCSFILRACRICTSTPLCTQHGDSMNKWQLRGACAPRVAAAITCHTRRSFSTRALLMRMCMTNTRVLPSIRPLPDVSLACPPQPAEPAEP
jgi:hypothetical protein